jgi:nitrogen fixation/metabolism regulation signal transduction histidine kinase
MLQKTEHRLAIIIVVTVLLPLAVAIMFANSMFRRAEVWVNPDVGQQLDRGVSLYRDYIKAVKDDMKHQADAIAADKSLREAARAPRGEAPIQSRLATFFTKYPELVSLSVESADGDPIASRDRGRPIDEETERKLEVRRPLGDDETAAVLVATFAFDRKWENELAHAGEVRDGFTLALEERDRLNSIMTKSFAALLAGSVLVTALLGFVLARGVTKRINRLAVAIERVATGDLSVRVPVTGSDELTELARVFNRMLGEMEQSRARIEYLQRIGAWQEMAQRLAHEIKNPLTPIQLAVQECHRKYGGDDPRFRTLLDTTLEIVEEEVGTLRRLVGNFSSFARLPQAELKDADLRDFMRECSDTIVHLDEGTPSADSSGEIEALVAKNVAIDWEIPSEPLPAAIDRQMLRRVLVNLVRNAAQAIRDARAKGAAPDAVVGRVVVSARADGAGSAIVVDDDGPGVPEGMRARIFDPYFTTKVDGTGLGLAIVKKVVVEHGGTIDVEASARLAGARFVLRLPPPTSAAIAAVRARASQPRATNPA